MIDPKIFDDLSKRFAETIPSGIRQMQSDIEKNAHVMLQAAFAKMDLVTREEFDVQQGVLARTRAKLEALEKQVAELEAQLCGNQRKKQTTQKKEETTEKSAHEDES
jgi:BMFP domain-containing protein YqiC